MLGSHINDTHRVQGVLYASWVWEMIYNRNEDKLNLFGPYMEGVSDDDVLPELKVFMFLETMIQSERDSQLFEDTSSTLVLECVKTHVDFYVKSQTDSIVDLYERMIEDLSNYMGGC